MKRQYSAVFPVILCLFNLTAFAADDQTQVRVIGEPTGTFETQFGTTDLKSARVEVRNVGSVPATGVHARVIVSDGRSGTLYGPDMLAPGQKAVYSSDAVVLPVTKGGKLRAEATCANCGTRSAASSNSGAEKQLTTLRTKTPIGVFNNIGGTTYLIDGSVEVKNSGSVPAQGVRVLLKMPGGDTEELRGPDSIPANRSQVYRSRLFQPIASNKKLEAIVSCSNCR